MKTEDILIQGALRHEHQKDNGVVHVCELEAATMFRSIHLPKNINPEKVKAEFRNGMLKVTAEVAVDSHGKNTTLEAA